MSSEELRQAAGLMRERAEAAGAQSWEPNSALSRNPLSETGATYIRHEVRGPQRGADWPFIAEANATQYAAHIASWHPAVALAVADSLIAAAVHIESHDCEAHCEPDGCDLVLTATRTARAYLGSAS